VKLLIFFQKRPVIRVNHCYFQCFKLSFILDKLCFPTKKKYGVFKLLFGSDKPKKGFQKNSPKNNLPKVKLNLERLCLNLRSTVCIRIAEQPTTEAETFNFSLNNILAEMFLFTAVLAIIFTLCQAKFILFFSVFHHIIQSKYYSLYRPLLFRHI